MRYVQFYQKSAISDELIEACGDRSVIILDGREKESTHKEIGFSEGKRRGYEAFRLFSGESFSRSSPTTGMIEIAK